ncbi:hypothetical protein [Sorangium sp. So ce861]|uniref:hypothetical protein n=1 Tax=Sorangium sp. So ce861 TaxID=3133323 RepID=UPI003F5E70C9
MKRIAACSLALACSVATGTVLLSSPGCGDSVSSACAGVCDCWQCSAGEYAECVDSLEDAAQSAERKGCPEAAEAFVRCVDADVECMADMNASAPTRCKSEQDALVACGVEAPVLGPSCERGVERMKECNVSSPIVVPCARETRCMHACYAMATCDEVLSGSSRRLTECIAQCAAATPAPAPTPAPPPSP